jgi:hypothetical protein
MFPPTLMLLARYAAPGSHYHGTSLISVSAREQNRSLMLKRIENTRHL